MKLSSILQTNVNYNDFTVFLPIFPSIIVQLFTIPLHEYTIIYLTSPLLLEKFNWFHKLLPQSNECTVGYVTRIGPENTFLFKIKNVTYMINYTHTQKEVKMIQGQTSSGEPRLNSVLSV
jgi:hypothetical protein